MALLFFLFIATAGATTPAIVLQGHVRVAPVPSEDVLRFNAADYVCSMGDDVIFCFAIPGKGA